MALTATATPQVQQDIISNLSLKNPFVAISSFARANLHLSVSLKSANLMTDLKKLLYSSDIQKHKSVIIYCRTIKDTESIGKLLNIPL